MCGPGSWNSKNRKENRIGTWTVVWKYFDMNADARTPSKIHWNLTDSQIECTNIPCKSQIFGMPCDERWRNIHYWSNFNLICICCWDTVKIMTDKITTTIKIVSTAARIPTRTRTKMLNKSWKNIARKNRIFFGVFLSFSLGVPLFCNNCICFRFYHWTHKLMVSINLMMFHTMRFSKMLNINSW